MVDHYTETVRLVVRTLLWSLANRLPVARGRGLSGLHAAFSQSKRVNERPDQLNRRGDEAVTPERFKDFMMGDTAPQKLTLDLYVTFLEEQLGLRRASLDTIAASSPSPRSSAVREFDDADLAKLTCLALHEAHARTESLTSALLLARGAKPHRLAVFRVERVYRGRASELAKDLQRRIDGGRCDEKLQQAGWVSASSDGFDLRMESADGAAPQASLHLDVGECQRRLVIQMSNESFVREYIDLGPDALKKYKHKKLTNRQLHNTVVEFDRLYSKGNFWKTPTREDVLNDEAKRYGAELLAASMAGSPLDMARALIRGANINSVEVETGNTALHWICERPTLFGASVLIHDPEKTPEICQRLVDEEFGNLAEIDHRLRVAQSNLDPLVLNRDRRFASELVDVYPVSEVYGNPLAELLSDIEGRVFGAELKALQARGLDPMLRYAPMAMRLDELGLQAPPAPETPGF